MKAKFLLISRHAILAVIWILFIAMSYSQEKLGGKEIKTGIWNGHEVKYMDGEVGVKLKPGTSPAQLNAVLNQLNARIKRKFDELGWGWLELPEGKDVMSAISTLKSLSFVETAEPNFVYEVFLEPNDPYFRGTSPATYPYQWALKNTGQTPPTGTNDADIDAPEAWGITTGSSNVIVAILDSGIPMLNGTLSHPDLDDQSKIILGPDYTDEFDDPTLRDRLGHGTHVAGIVAAETNNGEGVAGLAWNSKILVTQVFNQWGSGFSEWFYNGVKYAVDYQRNNPSKRVIINYSGGGSSSEAALDAVIS